MQEDMQEDMEAATEGAQVTVEDMTMATNQLTSLLVKLKAAFQVVVKSVDLLT